MYLNSVTDTFDICWKWKKSIYGVILTLPNILLRNLIGNPDFFSYICGLVLNTINKKILGLEHCLKNYYLFTPYCAGGLLQPVLFSDIIFSMQHPRANRVKKLNYVTFFNPDFLFLSFSFPIFQQFSKVCISKRFAIFYESTPHTSKTNHPTSIS